METSIKIKDVPMDERPRERLLQYGEAKLSNNELLAILIGSGTKNDSAIDLANRILMHFEGLKLLREATIEELTAIKGIGKAKGISILAALELGKRIHTYKPDDRVTIKSPSDGADYVMEEMRHLNQEHLVAMFLNTKNQIIHRQTIFIGSLNSSIVHPREIFREAVKRSAAAVILGHIGIYLYRRNDMSLCLKIYFIFACEHIGEIKKLFLTFYINYLSIFFFFFFLY